MERAKLIVKNFGPLKDIEIEVREMVTFIGAQASGKSTLAKLLSIFEDENFRRDEKITFEDELKKYNIFNYLKEDTIISYDNHKNKNVTVNSFTYENKKSSKFGSLNWLNIAKGELSDNECIDILKSFINFDIQFTILRKIEYIKKFISLFNLDEDLTMDLYKYLILKKRKKILINIDEVFDIINYKRNTEITFRFTKV